MYKRQPLDIPPIKGTVPGTDEETVRHTSDDEPFAALAFKIATDPFVGKLCFFRVYSGTVAAGSGVYNSVKDTKERMGRILQMHANHRQDIEMVYALSLIHIFKSDDVVGRVKTYEAIVKGQNVPKPGIPESFKVLIKELQSLALDVKVLDERCV